MLFVETHLKPGHADVNREHLEALKYIRKENLDYEETLRIYRNLFCFFVFLNGENHREESGGCISQGHTVSY